MNAYPRPIAASRPTALIARIELLPGKSPLYQATLPAIPVAGWGRDESTAIEALKGQLRQYVATVGFGPAADAILPVTEEGLELIGVLPDRIRFRQLNWSLRDLLPALGDPEVIMAANHMTRPAFEDRIVTDVPDRWDLSLASRFNGWLADLEGRPAKPIALDILPRAKVLGCHRPDRISLRPGRPEHELWRTLLHELAHYRVRGHRLPFVQELARVYLLFRRWQAGASGDREPDIRG